MLHFMKGYNMSSLRSVLWQLFLLTYDKQLQNINSSHVGQCRSTCYCQCQLCRLKYRTKGEKCHFDNAYKQKKIHEGAGVNLNYISLSHGEISCVTKPRQSLVTDKCWWIKHTDAVQMHWSSIYLSSITYIIQVCPFVPLHSLMWE